MKKSSALRDAFVVVSVVLGAVLLIGGFISALYLAQYYLAEPWNNVATIFLWVSVIAGGATLFTVIAVLSDS